MEDGEQTVEGDGREPHIFAVVIGAPTKEEEEQRKPSVRVGYECEGDRRIEQIVERKAVKAFVPCNVLLIYLFLNFFSITMARLPARTRQEGRKTKMPNNGLGTRTRTARGALAGDFHRALVVGVWVCGCGWLCILCGLEGGGKALSTTPK